MLAAQVGGRTSSRHPLAEFESFADLVSAARGTRDHAAAAELSAQFTAGYRTGNPNSCDTFSGSI